MSNATTTGKDSRVPSFIVTLPPTKFWISGYTLAMSCMCLEVGSLYAIDGGVFQCKKGEETGALHLNTYLGREENAIRPAGANEH